MSAPLVSVLMPIAGTRTVRSAAIRSILSQTLGDLELLLVGHDDVHERVANLPSDARIRPIARRGHGIVAALQAGLAAARGRYVARMDDDDLAEPDRLAVQLAHLRAMPEPGLVGARVRLIDEHGGEHGIGAGAARYADWLDGLRDASSIRDACFVENPLPHPTWFAERTLFERLGGYRAGDFPEDHDFVLRAWCARVPMSKPDAVLLHWREHPQRLTRTDRRYRREAFITLKASVIASPAAGLGLDAGRGAWIAGVGRSARRWCDALLDRNVTVHGFIDLAGPKQRQRKRHRPVIDYPTLQRCRGNDLVLSAVTQPAARRAVDAWCRTAGLVSGTDFLLGD